MKASDAFFMLAVVGVFSVAPRSTRYGLIVSMIVLMFVSSIVGGRS